MTIELKLTLYRELKQDHVLYDPYPIRNWDIGQTEKHGIESIESICQELGQMGILLLLEIVMRDLDIKSYKTICKGSLDIGNKT